MIDAEIYEEIPLAEYIYNEDILNTFLWDDIFAKFKIENYTKEKLP